MYQNEFLGEHGLVNGRTVCAFSQDFTAFGGSLSETNSKKNESDGFGYEN